MPFKSQKQHRFMRHLEAQGDLPEGTCSDWASKTDFSDLPEKAGSFIPLNQVDLFRLAKEQAQNSARLIQTHHDWELDRIAEQREDLDDLGIRAKKRRRRFGQKVASFIGEAYLAKLSDEE